ncbi:hypothetical protein GH808_02745 [Acetobacterium fimetarium]|uniref:PD-(D/E)XK endonuclease-like domain-containing protein n=1 Tax=Acetobacterium fimetarium TaxID=52691 RepID=A0ABR6WS41_9FIRM|nr:PD-(D/E)XK nuclease family protein [Acetobacterium fimetarium]MBC3803357.1 hypothetical protein [Acetobacterium fimetarium]
MIACPQETKQICDGMLDYPGVAENIINHEKDQLKHWGIVDAHSEFIKHQSAFESCCLEAQKPVAGHINPSKFLNHLASSCADAVYTELPFQLQVKSEKASELVDLLNLEEVEKTKPLYMRGIIDLVIVKDNDYTIIDYKTNARGEIEDLVKFKKNLEAIYKPQLDLYEPALKEMVGEAEVEARIYSLYN